MNFEALKLEAAGHINSALGEPVRYQFREGNIINLCAVFRMTDAQVDMGGQVSIDSQAPAANIRRCDIARKPRQGDVMVRRSVVYEVKQVRELMDASYDCLLMIVDSRGAAQPRDKT